MEKNSENKVKFGSVKELAFSMALYTSGSIFGPLVLFGFTGYFLDKYFNTKPLFILISVLLAFILTNVLLFKKIKNLMNEMDKQADKNTDSKKVENIEENNQ